MTREHSCGTGVFRGIFRRFPRGEGGGDGSEGGVLFGAVGDISGIFDGGCAVVVLAMIPAAASFSSLLDLRSFQVLAENNKVVRQD